MKSFFFVTSGLSFKNFKLISNLIVSAFGSIGNVVELVLVGGVKTDLYFCISSGFLPEFKNLIIKLTSSASNVVYLLIKS